MWLLREEFERRISMVRTRSEQKKNQIAKKRREELSDRVKANWIREQEKKIPAYSTATQIKKFWEVNLPISSEADWEKDSSLEVEESSIREVKNLKK